MLHSKWWTRFLVGLIAGVVPVGNAATKAGTQAPACRTEVFEGSVRAGKSFEQAIGGGLRLVLQPIQAGWILRVIPSDTDPAAVGNPGFHDYAEVATPPYNSVTPLSISTDFGFRAQDAVGWNPRRFRFVPTPAAYASVSAAYAAFERNGAGQSALAAQVAQAPSGLFTILDARLIAGTADQWREAAAVSSAFTETAHTFEQPTGGRTTALGKLLEIRFRVELELPPGFQPQPASRIVPHVCGIR